MSRHYPLEPIEPNPADPDARPGESIGMRLAAATAQLLLDIGAWRRRHADLSQAIIGVTLLMFGLVLGGGAAITDSYLHRGVESGSEQPYVVQPAAKTLATNVDIRPFVGSDPATITVPLAGAGFQIVRQEFSWNEIEQQRGDYTWETYDAIVTELARQGHHADRGRHRDAHMGAPHGDIQVRKCPSSRSRTTRDVRESTAGPVWRIADVRPTLGRPKPGRAMGRRASDR